MNSTVEKDGCPSHLAPLWTVSETNPSLFAQLKEDPLVGAYSIYGFFPQVYQLLYQQSQPAKITFDGRSRGQVAIIQVGETRLVIKPLQSQREDEIASLAGELDVGPHQHPSLPGFLTEELVSGCFFTQLPTVRVTGDSMLQIGQNLGRMIASLHQREIYYNDATLADPDGRSHLLVMPDNSCRLIDFGISLLFDRHPQVTIEETYNFVRTMPTFQMFSRMGAGPQEMSQFLNEYRQRLARTPKEEIMTRDLRFFEEGAKLAARRLGQDIVGPLMEGFQEAYR